MSSGMIITEAGEKDIPEIIRLARMTWPSAYSAILSPQQITYMLDQLYSPAALMDQLLNQGHCFLLAGEEGEPQGFASYSSLDNGRVFKLHKLYILPSSQGQGIGNQLIGEVIRRAREQGGTLLELNVNRHNPAREFYEKLGFVIFQSADIPIGKGFFMNDYLMRKKLTGS